MLFFNNIFFNFAIFCIKLGKVPHLEIYDETTVGPAELLTAVIRSKSQNTKVAQRC